MEAIPLHRLFNWLQNVNCTLVIDFRSGVNFSHCHIKQALHAESEELNNRLQKGPFLHIVIILDTPDVQSARKAAMERVTKVVALPVETICVLSEPFSAFLKCYEPCSALFAGTIFQSPSPVVCYPNEIMPGFLFLGNARQAGDVNVLRDLGITHIVDASGMEVSRSAAESLHLDYLSINIDDSPDTNIAHHFPAVLAFVDSPATAALEALAVSTTEEECAAVHMHRKPPRVLMHCQAGVSRGCSFVLCYLMHSGAASSLRGALQLVLTERPWVCPNPSFRRQLREQEKQLCCSQHPIKWPSLLPVDDETLNSHASGAACLLPSFRDDKETMEFIMTHFRMNAATFHATVFDDTPITAGRERVSLEELMAEEERRVGGDECFDPTAGEGEGEGEEETNSQTANKKKKKPFLRRGQGKKAAAATIVDTAQTILVEETTAFILEL
jgi:hypothetical protein